MRHKLGFTLIELLIVVAIIGILSAITYTGFGAVRDDAANKTVAAELKNMQIALELYKSENGVYPDIEVSGSCSDSGLGSSTSWIASPDSPFPACSNNMPYIDNTDGFSPDYIAEQMSWEKSNNDFCVIAYYVADDQSWYKLAALFCHAGATGPGDGVQPDDELAVCPSGCSECQGVTTVPFEDSPRFYNSMAVYGGDIEAACI